MSLALTVVIRVQVNEDICQSSLSLRTQVVDDARMKLTNE